MRSLSGLFRNGLWRQGRMAFSTTNISSYYSYEPAFPIVGRHPKISKAQEAVSAIKSDDRVFIQGAAATPLPLIKAMSEHGKSTGLKNVEVIHIHTEGQAEYASKEYEGIFRDNCLFIGGNLRKAVNEGRADFMPVFLSEIPLLFRRNILNIDVALVQVSQPDEHGFCSLGPSVDITRAAIQNAKFIVALSNPSMPRTFGDSLIHKSHVDVMVEVNNPLPEMKSEEPNDVEKAIGKLVAENLVDDGATLQMGIGSIPNSVLSCLHEHKDLGVHTEMFSDGVVELVEQGCITNAKKVIRPGKIVSSFAMGSRSLFKFIDNNPSVDMMDISFVNKVENISRNPKVTAINSCIEVDLTGQVVSDSIGTRMYSGVGGQIDFIRGAALGYDGLGKPILAFPSTTSKGETRVVPYIKQGAGVVTTRAHVHYIVTEYGIAYLFGKNLRQRAHALIQIAHPAHRENLEKEAFNRLKCMPSP
ncbi:uncharacterized protein LOC114537512 [Dendronephthya gigantea]|uniref:uncharacterized protein LOC114537512 n=1 Tax=Dendronephthya gigantea TaxID=151771 RepID=UPI00106B4CDB|nr:uncharacterized protein LOC114537512 [Dendronephthya gigantea]